MFAFILMESVSLQEGSGASNTLIQVTQRESHYFLKMPLILLLLNYMH